MVRVGEEGGEGRGDERGVEERLQGARSLGVDRVSSVHRRVQLEAEFNLPAHAGAGGDLPRADPRRLLTETGPEVARRLMADGVDVVLITPT